MQKLWPAEIAVQALMAEGVDTMFGLMGGHIQAIQDHAYRAGIRVVQVRHEQAAAHAADGYARVSGKPGVCFGTAGPGMLNMVTAIHMAHLARTPMVCLFGGHKEAESHRGTVQEAYAAEVCRSLTKWTVRITEPALTAHFIRKAYREAMTPPYGPVGLEFPVDRFNHAPVDPAAQVAYRRGTWRSGPAARQAAEPAVAAHAMSLLRAAKRPLILGGDGIHWSEAAAVLKMLIERLQIPFNLRRLGRGAIPESHPLAVSGGARKTLIGEADVVLLIGLSANYLESFGDWKTSARFIQLQTCAEDVVMTVDTAVEMVGDPRTMLDQMLASDVPTDTVVAKDPAWSERARASQTDFMDRLAAERDEVADDEPIHPRMLANEISQVVTSDVHVVFDSFTASTFLGEQLRASRSAQILDAGLSAAFGHGVGISIGAQMACPDRRVIAVMGDGGMGLGGGDIETAMRYELPIVFVVYNDSTFCAGMEQYCYGDDFRVLGPGARKGFRLTQDVRYDQMYAPLGCHTEHVCRPGDIGTALRRALASGRTAVVNVVGTRHVRHPLYDTVQAREMFWHLPAAEVEEPARRRHHEHFYPKFHDGEALDR